MYVDTVWEINDFRVGGKPSIIYRIRNSGTTPAYRVRPKGMIIWDYDFKLLWESPSDTVGFVFGYNVTKYFDAWFYGRDSVLTKNDSIAFSKKEKKLLFISKIDYEDSFGGSHYTQQGFTQSVIEYPVFIDVNKYSQADHHEKNNNN
jgi:hypothetical protein